MLKFQSLLKYIDNITIVFKLDTLSSVNLTEDWQKFQTLNTPQRKPILCYFCSFSHKTIRSESVLKIYEFPPIFQIAEVRESGWYWFDVLRGKIIRLLMEVAQKGKEDVRITRHHFFGEVTIWRLEQMDGQESNSCCNQFSMRDHHVWVGEGNRKPGTERTGRNKDQQFYFF